MFNELLAYLRGRRILQINGRYIPQVRVGSTWEGISQDNTTWVSIDSQVKYCSLDTYNEAVNHYYSYLKIKKKRREMLRSQFMPSPMNLSFGAP
jgi:hypothetical protein